MRSSKRPSGVHSGRELGGRCGGVQTPSDTELGEGRASPTVCIHTPLPARLSFPKKKKKSFGLSGAKSTVMEAVHREMLCHEDMPLLCSWAKKLNSQLWIVRSKCIFFFFWKKKRDYMLVLNILSWGFKFNSVWRAREFATWQCLKDRFQPTASDTRSSGVVPPSAVGDDHRPASEADGVAGRVFSPASFTLAVYQIFLIVIITIFFFPFFSHPVANEVWPPTCNRSVNICHFIKK